MKQRVRRPLQEGSLKAIFKLLIHPLLKNKPDNFHFQDWLDSLFGIKERVIRRFVSEANFEIRGLMRITDRTSVNKVQYLKILKGAEVWVRTDKRHPNQVDVEVMNNQGSKIDTFWLLITRWQLRSMLKKLKEKPFRISKRSIFSWEKNS